MAWTFNPAQIKAGDLKTAKAGDFLVSLRSGTSAEMWLKLAGETPAATMLNLTGKNAMVVWNVTAQTSLPTLLIAEGPNLELEVNNSKGVGSSHAAHGSLLMADSGAYFSATVSENGSTNDCYISLTTWSVTRQYVDNVRASFSTWRLVDNSRRNDKRILLTFGDWS